MKEVSSRNIRSIFDGPSWAFVQLDLRKPAIYILFGWVGNLTNFCRRFEAEPSSLLCRVPPDSSSGGASYQSIKISSSSWRPINAFVWPFPFLVITGCCVTWWFIARVQAYFLSPLTCSPCHVNCECHIKLAPKSDKSTENLSVFIVTFFPSHAYFQNPWPVEWFHTA